MEGLSCALQASQAVLSMPLVVTDWSVSPSDAVAPTPVDSTGRVLFARQGPDADSLKNVQQHTSDAIERRHKSSLKVRTHLACMVHVTQFCPALKLWRLKAASGSAWKWGRALMCQLATVQCSPRQEACAGVK